MRSSTSPRSSASTATGARPTTPPRRQHHRVHELARTRAREPQRPANVVAPGYVQTQLTDVLPEEATKAMLDQTLLGRLGDPGDVAGAVRFLCSDEASFVTGEVLLVDGGLGM